MVKRYEGDGGLASCRSGEFIFYEDRMDESPTRFTLDVYFPSNEIGRYVEFTDYESLERERDALREALEGLARAVENLGYGTIGECEDARQLLAKEST